MSSAAIDNPPAPSRHHGVVWLALSLALLPACKRDDKSSRAEVAEPPSQVAPASEELIDLMGVKLPPPRGGKEVDRSLSGVSYLVEQSQTLLSVEVVPAPCQRSLEPEWESWQKLRDDPGSPQAALNQVVRLERRSAQPSGFEVEAVTRIPEEVTAGAPGHPLALTFVCNDRVAVAISVSQREGDLSQPARELLATTVAALKLP